MAKGNVAKEQVTNTIINAFGDKFIGISDKKIYVWAEENGEQLQIAISMTMPKTQIVAGDIVAAPIGTTGTTSAPAAPTPVDISPEDKEAVEMLKKKLGVC